jgi:hypothetical protein
MPAAVESKEHILRLIVGADAELTHTKPLSDTFQDVADPDTFRITENYRIIAPVKKHPELAVVLTRVQRYNRSDRLNHTRLELYAREFDLLESDMHLKDQGRPIHQPIGDPLVQAAMYRYHWSNPGAGRYCHIETKGLVIPSSSAGVALEILGSIQRNISAYEVASKARSS